MNVRPLAFALLMLAGCSGPTQPTSAACDDNSDCAEGLVCRAAQCVECGGDQDCPGHAGCGLTTPGRCGCRDADGDGHSCDDCDDVDARRFPGAPESCDEVDNDCDGVVDEDVLTRWYSDDDGDGFGNDALSISRCVAPLGFVARGGDCGDLDPTIAPGAPEVCDGRDNDCDGETDEAVRVTYFRDSDGDGFGDPRNAVSVCQIPAAGFVTMGGDCDDSRADANPEALETCNGRDDDCDGVVDRVTRSCANACGDGLETCTRGVWGGCTAPPILTVSNQLNVTAPASFACVVVTGSGRLAVAADAGVHVTGWLRTEGVAVVELGPRAVLSSDGDLTFAEQSALLGSDATVTAAGTISVVQNARWFFQSPQAAAYSAGGSPACASLAPGELTSGGGGGARGGAGGRGGTCGALQTQRRAGAGGGAAVNGSDGCGCSCTQPSDGAAPSGGGGGAVLAGGGGGANGGAGGQGGGGRFGALSGPGGLPGLAESGPGTAPSSGGAAGGSGGAASGPIAQEACQGGGGAGAGIVRVRALRLHNEGLLSADGAPGETSGGSTANVGGGGGGAGGTFVLEVDVLENLGAISAVGGRGGTGRGTMPGGGGGGGGGRVHLQSRQGAAPTLNPQGSIFVGGGAGGTGPGGAGASGESGWVYVVP